MRNSELDAYIVFLLTMSKKYDAITHEIYNLTFVILILLQICLLEPRSDVPVTVLLQTSFVNSGPTDIMMFLWNINDEHHNCGDSISVSLTRGG